MYTDFLVISMAIFAIRLVQFTELKQIFILFFLMIIYDIIGVFVTGTIVQVAKKMPLDLPLKLLLPK